MALQNITLVIARRKDHISHASIYHTKSIEQAKQTGRRLVLGWSGGGGTTSRHKGSSGGVETF